MPVATPAVTTSPLRSATQLLFRSFPFPTEPGLRVFGNPDRTSPVFVTGNFDHTVRLVSRVLRDYDCYLLVAPTDGVNVWCASAGGHFGVDQVEAAIKLSGIDDLVDHHRLVLPRLTTPGVDPKEVRRRTGWRVVFGPIDIADLPTWLDESFPRLVSDRVTFPLRTRVEMGIGAGLWPAGLLGVPSLLIAGWKAGLAVMALSYVLSVLFAVVYPRLPTKPGLPQAIPLAAITGAIGFGAAAVLGQGLFGLIFWPVVMAGVGALVALDFPSWSPTDVCKQELLCFLYPATLAPPGFLPTVDEPACIAGCDICVKVCPKGALTLNMDSKAFLNDPDGCISCFACVQQCPVDAIS
ncbi:HgcAB-like fusion protein [Lentzea flaviverrucosa]|uniref:4Fe-4S dicluster domain-containing protein n=1 Tax=Lentzea flaviverrucosa TaxID=200379 RepID=A0A1H9ENT2_9PSEU|nr:HgcAB-like fusion protein [Lentzea flaviverrucosa]RDI35432.1 4Fe-4S dicluster protein [Lentzea flaviverrucosa]SEQ27416.1 4Fe-4S dicluster domain-containing protein [Lentzea flaviverrucosa]